MLPEENIIIKFIELLNAVKEAQLIQRYGLSERSTLVTCINILLNINHIILMLAKSAD